MENIEISFDSVLEVISKRWHLILIATILCAALAFAYATFAIVPMYGLSVTFMVNPEFGNSQATTIVTETQSYVYAKDATMTYMSLLSNNEFFDLLYESIEGKCIGNYTMNSLKGMISFSSINETELFKANVKSPIPEDTYTISMALQEIAPDRIKELRGFNVLKVVDRAQLKNIGMVNDNTAKYTIIGAIAGAVISLLFFLALKLADNRIIDEADVRKNYDIPILGVIPNFEEATNQANVNVYGGEDNEEDHD